MNRKGTYAISAGNQYTVDAAETILANGGNAIDAAIAAYWMCMVAEPFMASAGAGGFALIRETSSKIHSLDFFCQTPQEKLAIARSDFFPIEVDFGTATEEFHIGMGSVAVPGAIAMLFDLHERWATIPMYELVTPAVEASRQGLVLDEFQTYEAELLECIFSLSIEGRSIFYKENKVRKGLGDSLYYDHFGDFAESISREGRDLFYKGEISRTIAKLSQEKGGHISRSDLEQYQVIYSPALSIDYGKYRIHTSHYPSVGAMILASLLIDTSHSILAGEDPLGKHHLEALSSDLQRSFEIKDNFSELIDKIMKHGGNPTIPISNSRKWGGTSHFNIIDSEGMAISLSTSIGEGCGTFIPGTDMQLNNMLGESALLPNGLHSWEEDVRLQSMMCPTIVTGDDLKLAMLIGSGGAGRIPFAMAQTIINHLSLGMDLDQAVAHPRVIYDGQRYHIECGYDLEGFHQDYLEWDHGSLFFGGTHAISTIPQMQASGDPRRYGKSMISR